MRFLRGSIPFFAALAAYLLLQQETLYSVDAHTLLMRGSSGVDVHKYHFAYLPLLALFRELTSVAHATIHQAGILLSAAGTAAGVAFMHAANRRLGLPRPEAALATALAAVAPGVVFYATVVELHGPYLGLCGPAFLATALFVERPGVRRGALLGLGTVLGYAGHATGALLPAILFPFALVLALERGAPLRVVVKGLIAGACVHGLMLLALPPAIELLSGHRAPVGEPADWLAHPLTPATLLYAAWHDWLRAFCPVAPICLYALCVRRSRFPALAVLAGAACYVAITAKLIGIGTERGAYLLPLAWPAGVVAVRALSRAALVPLLLAGAALAVTDVKLHDTKPYRPFAAGFRAAIGQRKAFVIAGGHDEAGAFLVHLPEADWHLPINELAVPPEQLEIGLQVYDAWLDGKTAAGAELWITAGGVATLRDPGWTRGRPAGPRLLQHLRERYDWEEHDVEGFRAWRLVRQ